MAPGSLKRCYVASPCGFAPSTKSWYAALLEELGHLVDVVDPWVEDVEPILRAPIEQRRERWIDLGVRHYGTIDECSLLVAILDQEPPDNGTVCEVAHAAARLIPVIGYREDSRTSGEDGVPVNLMILAAIRRSGGQYTTSVPDLLAAVEARL